MVGTRAGCGPILIVDDDPGALALVTELLAGAGYEVVEAERAEEALAAARRRPPLLAILDVNLPGVSGYQLCSDLKEELGDVPVIFLSGERTESFDRVAGLMLGADDYIVKPFAPDELLARVRSVLRRAAPGAAERVSPLTKRELEVLRLLAEGRSQREIASELVITPKTVGTHIEHILEKLGVHSRAQAVAAAYRDDIIGASA